MIRYFIAWFGIMLLAILNGAFREFVIKNYASNLTAHQISTITLLILFSVYLWIMMNYFPITSSSEALLIGIMWLLMTLTFEFGFGHYISGNSWSSLLEEYNILAGKVWIFIPLWVLIAPYIFYKSRV